MTQRIIGLVGNPNCGKSTVFNGLTGARQRVGNWPGVTVERKSGFFQWKNTTVEVVDLPGVYSMTTASETSLDERIACEFIQQGAADVVVNILDASHLERHLYLTLQLLDMQVPVIIAVNMMDVARARHIDIVLDVLEKALGCPVVPLEAHQGVGITALKQAMAEKIPLHASYSKRDIHIPYPVMIENAIIELTSFVHDKSLAIRLLEEDAEAHSAVPAELLSRVREWQHHIRTTLQEDPDILIADARYRFIQDLMARCVRQTKKTTRIWTDVIDKVVLNRFLGIPIFLAVMYSLFVFAINVGGAFQDFFDIASHTIFVEGLATFLHSIGAPAGVVALLANGIGKGIHTTVTFVPVIGAMFFALAFLEDSGYMARAAFIIDRFMQVLGLPGKAFIPMIVGFGCNVPAVMAARTLENKRDRILTAMMSPFMSCGARLAIFTVFVAAFFPRGGQNVVFILYLAGIVMAVLTGLLLRQTLLKGDPAPLIMELPPYHVPHIKTLLLQAWQRLKGFVFRAGKLIVPICVLIGAFNAFNIDGTLNHGEGDAHSLLSTVGQWVTPLFAPMGIHQDNWPATVGLVTGVLAKEVVIGTLNTLYSQLGHFTALPTEAWSFLGGLHDALVSIPANLGQLGDSLGNPVLAKAPIHALSQSVYGLMYQRFDGQVGAMAYLLFVLLYFPCVSTTAVMVRELGRAWAGLSVVWSTLVAYGASVGFYQLATFARHPISSAIWMIGIVIIFIIIALGLSLFAHEKQRGGQYELAGY